MARKQNIVESSLIGNGCHFLGNIESVEPLTISGTIKGSIISSAFLKINDKAKIIGNIDGNTIEICGSVEGSIVADDYLLLTETAQVNGDISARRLEIRQGCTLNGQCSIGEEAEVKLLDLEYSTST